MNAKWFTIFALIAAATLLLTVSSCGNPQKLVSITIEPSVETIGASDIPVIQDAGSSVQLRALGNYIHPPVTKDITTQVAWTSNTPQMFTVDSAGLLTATGLACGNTLISATVTTNSDARGLSSSGALVTGSMTANVVCFTGTGGGSNPAITVNFLGNGTGTVTSSPSGIDCASTGGTCVGTFTAGTPVVLTATPIGAFGGWSGACDSISGETCSINNLNADVSVTATFN